LANAAPLLFAGGAKEDKCRREFDPVLAYQFSPLGALDVHPAHHQLAMQFFL